jgi:hypothetical protein
MVFKGWHPSFECPRSKHVLKSTLAAGRQHPCPGRKFLVGPGCKPVLLQECGCCKWIKEGINETEKFWWESHAPVVFSCRACMPFMICASCGMNVHVCRFVERCVEDCPTSCVGARFFLESGGWQTIMQEMLLVVPLCCARTITTMSIAKPNKCSTAMSISSCVLSTGSMWRVEAFDGQQDGQLGDEPPRTRGSGRSGDFIKIKTHPTLNVSQRLPPIMNF